MSTPGLLTGLAGGTASLGPSCSWSLRGAEGRRSGSCSRFLCVWRRHDPGEEQGLSPHRLDPCLGPPGLSRTCSALSLCPLGFYSCSGSLRGQEGFVSPAPGLFRQVRRPGLRSPAAFPGLSSPPSLRPRGSTCQQPHPHPLHPCPLVHRPLPRQSADDQGDSVTHRAILAREAADFCHSWKSTLGFLVTVTRVTVTCFMVAVMYMVPLAKVTSYPLGAVIPAVSLHVEKLPVRARFTRLVKELSWPRLSL